MRDVVERESEIDHGDIEGAEDHAGNDRRADNGAQHMFAARRAGDGSQRHLAVVILRLQAEWQHGEKNHPPQDEVDREDRNPAHDLVLVGAEAAARSWFGASRYTCSNSTSVPKKSLGCRNSTGLPCAPIFGLPSPSTRAPDAVNRSRAAMMSSTS